VSRAGWRSALACLLLAAFGPQSHGRAQSSSAVRLELTSQVQELVAQKRWAEVVAVLQSVPRRNVEQEYAYGTALAQLGRYDEARAALLAGRAQATTDKRFPTELAGVDFRQKRFASARRWLRIALRLDQHDTYANDFLGTLYFLDDNLDAAVKYWNRADKPYIATIQHDEQLRIRPALLDRSLVFAPASEMRLADLETTRLRLEGLGVFRGPRVQLAARDNGEFDAELSLPERNGWGSNVWTGLLSTFSGVAYQTIYPEYDNIRGSATSVRSLMRWDAQKRRLAASLDGPLHQNPKWHYALALDLRNENWDIRQSFTGPSPTLGSLNLRREAGIARVSSLNSGRWEWDAGVEFSHRDYRNVVPGTAIGTQLLLTGSQLKQFSDVRYVLWRAPERRFRLSSQAAYQVGRIWSQPAHAFGKLLGTAQAQWFPQAHGDDYAVSSDVRAGGISGQVPFDELYQLGMERDNDLWLRAHVGTRAGRKGSAPLGTEFFLSNQEMDKNLWGNGLVTVKLSPFVDTGKITGAGLSSGRWLWDTGLQAKVRVLGLGLTFVYGKDLRTGNNAYYFTAGRGAQAGNAEVRGIP
jgi:tetratricopeptide (TPR) repeat protein